MWDFMDTLFVVVITALETFGFYALFTALGVTVSILGFVLILVVALGIGFYLVNLMKWA